VRICSWDTRGRSTRLERSVGQQSLASGFLVRIPTAAARLSPRRRDGERWEDIHGGWATFLGGIKGGAPLLALFETGHAATLVCTNYVMANCGAARPQQPQPPKPKPTLKQQACNALWSYAKQDMVVAGVDRGIAFTISKASWGLNPFADGTRRCSARLLQSTSRQGLLKVQLPQLLVVSRRKTRRVNCTGGNFHAE
jgi:hypothetical protein